MGDPRRRFFEARGCVREVSVLLSPRQTLPQARAHPLFRQIVADEDQQALTLFRRPP